jgi:hypothetical protein
MPAHRATDQIREGANMHSPRRFAHSRRRAGRAGQAGVTMVEFAIVSPFALLMVMGIIQLGLMFSAKEVLNEAAFLAARAGAVANADTDSMQGVLQKALIPFYQNTTVGNDLLRLTEAATAAKTDFELGFIKLEVMNPTAAAFTDFGITGKAFGGRAYIPNDNLEYRLHTATGKTSGLSIQDANALKIKVTYGYQLKVPLMAIVVEAIMCGVDSGLDAFGRTSVTNAGPDDCATYYYHGRIPMVTYATVQMQTPALKPED